MGRLTSLFFLLLLGLHGQYLHAEEKERIDLNVLMFPYVPAAASGIERFEKSFEEYCGQHGVVVDLDLELRDTYSDTSVALEYDVAEIDLSMIDKLLEKENTLANISEFLPQRQLTGPATKISSYPWKNQAAPHWVCGNFFVNRTSNKALHCARDFEELLQALDPGDGKALYADLWGGSTLGELYADAVLDTYGKEYARIHLSKLADIRIDSEPENESTEQAFVRFAPVITALDSNAVLKLYRLTQELDPKLKKHRKQVHNTPYIVPRIFADEKGGALLGYSERLYHVERDNQDEPWDGDGFPISKNELSIRQFPFHYQSNGTPAWCDAFVVPQEKLEEKRDAIKLFLKYALSQAGYQMLLEPRKYYPAAYLLPAYKDVIESEFSREKMPLLESYAKALDDSFPVFETKLYNGLDQAGEALKLLLKK